MRFPRAANAGCVVVLAVMMATPAMAQMFPTFPPAGVDYIPGTGLLEIRMLPEFGGQLLAGALDGTTIVERGDPYTMGGQQIIATEMVSMNLSGEMGPFPAQLYLLAESPGMIIDENPDPDNSFPARSFFDVFFEVLVLDTPMGDLLLHNVDPLRMEATIIEIPPNLAETPFQAAGWIPFEDYRARDPDALLRGLPLILHAPDDMPMAELLYASHPPEPGVLAVLLAGGVALLRRRRY